MKEKIIKLIEKMTIPDLGIQGRPHICALHTQGWNEAKWCYAEEKIKLIEKIKKMKFYPPTKE